MITIDEYFGPFADHLDATSEVRRNAKNLIEACAKLEALAVKDGVEFPDNPATGSGVSGRTYGGFRPQSCPQGARRSAHKTGEAVDRYDPHARIGRWCLANSGKGGALEQCGIYIEHPDKTNGWCHWSTRAPGSGRRVFYP